MNCTLAIHQELFFSNCSNVNLAVLKTKRAKRTDLLNVS